MLFFAVLLSTFSASMVQSEGEHQKADCALNRDSMVNAITINDDHRDMDHVGPVGDLKYCEVRGTFVFYSQEGYKVTIHGILYHWYFKDYRFLRLSLSTLY